MEDANERKARLKALRAAAREEDEAAAAAEPAAAEEPASAPEPLTDSAPPLKFRNYVLRDKKKIDHEPVEAVQPPKQEPAPEPEPEETDKVRLRSTAVSGPS